MAYEFDRYMSELLLHQAYSHLNHISPPQKEEDMLEVGKVAVGQSVTHSAYNDTVNTEVISVSMSEHGIHLGGHVGTRSGGGGREKLYPSSTPKLTPDMAIELGQLLLKAAEVQPKYGETLKKLAEEKDKVEARYKDLVGGLGIADDVEIDVTDEHGTFTVSKALG